MIETKYAVAYRAEGAADWQGLAAYPWYDDLKGAEALKVFLEKTRALPFEYAVATLTIGDARASSPDPAREALVGAPKRIVSDFETDYVLSNGEVVDDPAPTHRMAWEVARRALAEQGHKGATK